MLRPMSFAAAPTLACAPDHIVDTLVAERAPRLVASPAWPLLRPLFDAALGYGAARRLADAVAPLGGREAMAHVSAVLALRVSVRGLARLPSEGPVIIACNHPTGMADGVALFDALVRRRPDLCALANADALRVAPGLAEVIVPVDWAAARRTPASLRRTLAAAGAALAAGRALAIFPAGRLARRGADLRLVEPAWRSGALALARRFGASVVPAHLAGPSSTLFQLLHHVSTELRDITLFHEMLNKRGRDFRLTLGPAVSCGDLPRDLAVASAALRAYVTEVLPSHPDRPFARPSFA
jgi:putative hemolysin